MRCEYGYCLICDKEIAKKCETCETRKPTDDYTEVQLQWSNGSKMNTAVCVECATQGRVHSADRMEMTKAVWKAWERQGGSYDPTVTLVG